MSLFSRILLTLLLLLPLSSAQEAHSHGAPEKLGKVSFPTSCAPAVQEQFDRGVALLHSFAYSAAKDAFQGVAERDPRCAMAHWGMAMSYFRQLWDPPLVPETIPTALKESQRAQQIAGGSERERGFINALALIYQDAATVPYRTRASNYEHAMADLAAQNKDDVEAQVLYALALLANVSPSDKTHARQKQVADLLEPLDRSYPQHPGIPHYLIHAYDNAELAPRGLPAARAYSQIAPSAPHALHMPSHIFTRLGLWEDSITSNLAAREAAHQQGDPGEELHAMDYLVYAYLQSGRDSDAAQVIQQLKAMPHLAAGEFKVAYASTAMPIRYAVERGQWADAAGIVPPAEAPPHVTAIAVWAKGLGLARSGRPAEARAEIDRLRQIEKQLRASGNDYWAVQAGILTREVMAWSAQADGKPDEAAALLRQSADEEDAIEKLPVTPGPILPAREQLGYLLLEQHQSDLALKEFQAALTAAPGRRGALLGVARAAYVGDEACQPCHAEKVENYHRTSHYLTSRVADASSILGSFAPGQNIFKTSDPTLYFQMDEKQSESKPAGSKETAFFQTSVSDSPTGKSTHTERLDLIIGSGGKGQTYLFWKENKLFQLPVSYWTGVGWINSPGYPDGFAIFDRSINARCLECHATYFQALPEPNTYRTDNYTVGLECEKCHGQGRNHVDRERSKPDLLTSPAIPNPARFSRDRQMDLCAWCHGGLGRSVFPPFSYVPGEFLSTYLAFPPPPPNLRPDVHGNQIGMLERSRCFTESTMTCLTCHDVHVVQHDAAGFSKLCLNCHAPSSATFSKPAHPVTTNCIDCHMPRQETNLIVSERQGTKVRARVRSHWIKVYPEPNPPAANP